MKPDYTKLFELLAAAHYGVNVKKLRSLAGMRFPDGGGYELEVQADATFVVTLTPPDDPQMRGVVIFPHHRGWGALAAVALAQTL